MIDTEVTQQREGRTKTSRPLSKVNGEKVKGYEETREGHEGAGGALATVGEGRSEDMTLGSKPGSYEEGSLQQREHEM